MKSKNRVYTNELFRKVTYIYLLVLVILGLLAGSWAYKMETAELNSRLQMSLKDIYHVYESRTEEFWRIYMPIFNNRESVYASLRTFFLAEKESDLSPMDKSNLLDALSAIMGSDNSIKWVGIYSGKEGLNYLLFEGDPRLVEMTDSFPFLQNIKNKGSSMEIYASRMIDSGHSEYMTFALCGGTYGFAREGSIIIGYATSDFISTVDTNESDTNVRFCVVNDNGVIYDSLGQYSVDSAFLLNESGRIVDAERNPHYVGVLEGTEDCYVFYIVPWIEWVFANHSLAPLVLLLVLIFWVFSLVIYRWSEFAIARKIVKIQTGLHEIGENRLDYRIPVAENPSDEFERISMDINEVAHRLKLNIDLAYASRLKQREAEMMELQAKFDPHFLYNTLDVIRGKVYENGDMDTADIIVNLAQIFRSLIDAEQFVTIQDELEFCNRYLTLLKYRYDEKVTVVYDVETEVLQYGIVRNLLQPILENYFVHGFCSEKTDNTLWIRGKIIDGNYIHFIVRDNGSGILENRLQSLKQNLETMVIEEQSSYGLRNVNKRIHIFYGPECFLHIDNNEDGGATIEIRIRKLTCEEHESRMKGEL